MWMMSASVQTYNEIISTPPKLIPSGFEWVTSWQHGNLVHSSTYTVNSIVIDLLVLVIQFFTMVPAAYAFARMEFKGKMYFGLNLDLFNDSNAINLFTQLFDV